MSYESVVGQKLLALRARERDVKAKIAAEQIRLGLRHKRETAKVHATVGRAVVEVAAQNPEGFGLMLKQVLTTAITERREQDLLRRHGVI